MKNAAMISTAALALVGCATLPAAPVTQQRMTRPDVGVITSREVGEPLFEVEVASRFPGVRISPGQQLQGPFGSKVTYLSEEVPVGMTDRSGGVTYCGPVTMQPALGFPQQVPFFCMTEAQLRKAGAQFSVGMITRNDPANFGQQLLYQGKSGNTLKLSYREFTGDMARPAFTQDLTFDLSDGPVIGTKGARVEVLEATNTSIRYRLLQPFSAR